MGVDVGVVDLCLERDLLFTWSVGFLKRLDGRRPTDLWWPEGVVCGDRDVQVEFATLVRRVGRSLCVGGVSRAVLSRYYRIDSPIVALHSCTLSSVMGAAEQP